ncbi:hypothetical protein JCM10207_002825 [Rhodosporidiobolus poonsookiae]
MGPGGPHRFSRGHARKKGQPGAPPPPKATNPNDVDLMALEEPDEVFRLFGVRDVRKLEKRASEAAAAKAAELRAMVGERYRDLLAAADSIVRMRSAAEKLVERLDDVDDAVQSAGIALEDTPTKPPGRRPSRRSISPSRDRTFSSAPTLSLTINLLLTLPSLVHTQLETSAFLPAARLEELGRVVYRALAEYEQDGDEAMLVDDGEPVTGILQAFPIVERQQEVLAQLKPLVLRRARSELKGWEADHLSTAQTLAAIVLLEDASTSSALSTLLDSRASALSDILNAPSSSRNDTAAVISSLQQVLSLVLRTVETAAAVFGLAGEREGLLAQLLKEVERPSLLPTGPADSATDRLQLSPILTAFPNYATLSKHLPASLLLHTPHLSASSSSTTPAPTSVQEQLDTWLATETGRVVAGITAWIATLTDPSSHAATTGMGAKPLSTVRDALASTLSPLLTSSPPSPAAPAARTLLSRLTFAIEARLAHLYTSHLSTLVARVKPSLGALLLALPSADATFDRDSAAFLFDAPLAFPTPSLTSSSAAAFPPSKAAASGHGAAPPDPFEAFLHKVSKRVAGRAPLVDRGVAELELAARDVRADLDGWLGSAAAAADGEAVRRLRKEYLDAAGQALKGIADALDEVIGEVEGDVQAARFVGEFAAVAGRSGEVVKGLLLGNGQGETEQALVKQWHARLAAVQSRSLDPWRTQAVKAAVKKLKEGIKGSSPNGLDASRFAIAPASESDLPTSPSSALLSCLHSLASSLNSLPLHHRADASVAQSLLAAFAEDAEKVASGFAAELEEDAKSASARAKAAQAAWDVALLAEAVSRSSASEQPWEELEEKLLRVALPSEDASALGKTLASSAHLYLQRTQSIFAPLLPSTPASTATTPTASKPAVPYSLQRLLPLGPPPSAASSASAAIGTPGLVKPGPRLGLLPTRG